MRAESRKHLVTLFGSNAWVNLTYLATFVILGALLDSVEFGTFRVVQAYLAVAISVAMLGLNTAVTHQFPQLTPNQKVTAFAWTKRTILITSLCAGTCVYVFAPSVGRGEPSVQGVLYFLSFPIAVAGASLCNVFLALYQAQGDLHCYARLQAQWKTLIFAFAMVGSVLLQAQTVLIAMALAYGGVYILLQRMKGSGIAMVSGGGESRAASREILVLMLRSGIWPFASICVSVVYSNAEFLYIKSSDLTSGIAGAYSLASLIFIGGAAFFVPLQTYAGSLVVNRQIELLGILKLQAACMIAVVLVAVLAFFSAHALSHAYPIKFNEIFLDFAWLVCLKLSVWGCYAVIGSVLNYLDKGFESFILAVMGLVGLTTLLFLADGVNSLREMVVLQIIASLIPLVGSIILVVTGYRGRTVHGG